MAYGCHVILAYVWLMEDNKLDNEELEIRDANTHDTTNEQCPIEEFHMSIKM